MTYTGDVVRGGPAAVRELADVVVRKVCVGPLGNNAYLLTCRASGAQLLIDAADDAPALAALVRAGSPAGRLDVVLTTHRHADHQRALRAVVAATGADTAAGADDAAGIDVPTTRLLHDGDVLAVGELRLEVIGLRGHTPGSVALAYREPDGRAHLFTGDSLFPGGVGNTDHDPTRFASLLDDVITRLFDRFDDATWVYPGHGPDTTLETDRPHLAQWRTRGW
ncbi:MBL fold metallo-hydrolase [Pengzhenrongella sicca]|uniref:MBL fold metallo-hydrolase n=1 Tax=Pengzhenrongella sicca TaxID=2819238 RepID=A0A8A4ZKU4_9MICO|nr:MBL fold metallo-hydrolase [Pengzhenrongella sicca]QTE31126.1 MBL fold metallo-hydrolase [Pengzhenrongella sicca]